MKQHYIIDLWLLQTPDGHTCTSPRRPIAVITSPDTLHKEYIAELEPAPYLGELYEQQLKKCNPLHLKAKFEIVNDEA